LLFITHDFGVVADIADQVAVMRYGQIVESGAAQEVLRAPQHPYTQALIAAIPHGRARRSGQFAAQPLLEVQKLCKTYRSSGFLLRRGREVHAARDLSFSLAQGETLGIVGESGSGKSTLGRLLTGLIASDSGHIQFDGKPLAPELKHRPMAQRSRIQMVFQDPYASLNPRHTVGAAIATGPLAQGRPKQEVNNLVAELLS
jgi:peptide/nickel transport system ATP-binding protein